MILKLRMTDGTYFDFDTERHIEYTDYGIYLKGKFVYKTRLSETFYEDYNIPRQGKGEGTPTYKQQEMTALACNAAKATVPLQIGRLPRKVQLLTPEEWFSTIEMFGWLARNMREESWNPWWGDYYQGLPETKKNERRYCFLYLVMVYGLCAKEAASIAKSSLWHKEYLAFEEDDEYNKRQLKYFDSEIQQVMKQKGIDFPQDVYTTAYD